MKGKNGISLIVLVITIIVMIILAASVVITLSNNGIINKATQAVQLSDEKQVQDLAALIWSEAYMSNLRGEDLIYEVTEKLKEQEITTTSWDIKVTDKNISVAKKQEFGKILTPDNYGDTVDYSVTVDDITYDDWRIFYHNSEYVYLIATDKVEEIALGRADRLGSMTEEETALYEIFRVGDAEKFELKEQVGDLILYNNDEVTLLVREYANYANTTDYGENVVGAIGGPTVELFVEAWKAKGYSPKISTTVDDRGYWINGTHVVSIKNDDLYVPADYYYWLVSQMANNNVSMMYAGKGILGNEGKNIEYGVRPVVCIKASALVTKGTGTTDFSLVK